VARETLNDNLAFGFSFMSGRFGAAQLADDTLYVLTNESHLSQYITSTIPGTAVRLPPISVGKFFLIANTGSEDLDIQSANGASLFTLAPGTGNVFHTEGATWQRLNAAGVVYDVFGGEGPGASDGLVPSPGAAQPTLRFLGSDAAWHLVTEDGIADGFAFITDGTNTANASGADTFRFRSSSGKITAVITNDEAVFGDNVNISVNEAAVDHDALLNFVANEHINHTSVSITGGIGLSGGGDISANRAIDLDIPSLTPLGGSLATTELFAIYNDGSASHVKVTFDTINTSLIHDNLSGFVANEHIDHTSVSISTGTGLTGGGTIAANRTISLDFSALPTQAEAMASGDTFPFFDLSGAIHKKVSWSTINTSLDHDALTNFVANEHIDHTAVTLTAGAGLTGGGDISASRSFAVGAGTGITVNADDVSITAATTTEMLTGTATNRVVTPDAAAALWEKGSNVASAGTVSFGEGGFFHVTGTTTITDIDFATAKDGRVALVVFDGVLTLTHNATTLILPNAGSNITTAAGDRACFVQDSSDNVICLWYQRADGTALVGGGGGAPTNAQYVTLATDGTLSAERVLVAGDGLTATDGGAGGNITLQVVGGTGIVANANDVAIDAATTTEVLTGTSTSDVVTPDALAALWEKGSDTASAGTVSLGEGGFFHITGTTTITDIDFSTAKDGRTANVVFDDILTLTHNATTLKLPGGTNITTAAGDRACFVQDASDNIVCLWYQRADGTPLAGGGGSTESWVKLTSNNTLTSSTTTQPLFDGGGGSANGALTLATGQYFFECMLHITGMSATSGNGEFEPLGAGTATMTQVLFTASGVDSSTPLDAQTHSGSGGTSGTANAASMVTATAGTALLTHIRGTFNISGAGTIIPSIDLVTAAAAAVNTGSYFRCVRVGATGDATGGSWS
jgi:hypothetical protein